MKLGKAFSDNVILEKKASVRMSSEPVHSWWLGVGRMLLFFTVLCVAFFVLIWRLFDLTVIQGHHFRSLADGNRTRELVRHAPRGILLDRTGKPLVENIAQYRLLKPCDKQTLEECTTVVSREEGERLAREGLPPGTFLEVDYRRRYLYPEVFSHVLGYIGELTEKELDQEYYKLRYYRLGDRVGRTGAEAVFEDLLRGRDGKELVEVNANGAIIRTLGRDKESPGENITLSIDVALQEAIAESFPKGAKGAVVVSKPATGEVLALYSSPTYDLNAFSTGLSQKEYDDLINNPDQPMFDRAIGGVYPPGSTFKLVTAMAALEEGAISKGTTVEDTGVLRIGPFTFPNWYFIQYGKTDGVVDVVKALQRSNDIFFYKTGEWLGITKLVAWAKRVGIGKPLGIELGGEASGLMPDPTWKRQRFSTNADKEARNDEWYVGDTYHISIGQGYLLVTPIQVNWWTNAVAHQGVMCPPTIRKVQGGFRLPGARSCTKLPIKQQTVDLITEGMREACEAGGTGWPLFDFSIPEDKTSTQSARIHIPIACKTGTAEFGHPKNHTHAWFTSFAPIPDSGNGSIKSDQDTSKRISGDPEISVTVLVEEGGEGSSVAAPVAKKVFEEWFGR